MKHFLFSLCILFATNVFGQTEERSDFRLSLTFEPLNFAAKGYSIWLGFRYKKAELGVTTFSIHTQKNTLFKTSEPLDIRLNNGTAFYARFYPLDTKSSPFIGFLLGRETWDIKHPASQGKIAFKNSFFTPQIGYQWVTLNDWLVINPNFRFILPFAPSSLSAVNGVDFQLNKVGFIPALDLGLGLNWN